MADSRVGTYEHRDAVRGLMVGMAMDLLHRGDVHDASKLVEPERPAFDEIAGRLASTTYGSDEYRETLRAFGWAIEAHYMANDHHPEHHADGVAGMTLVQVMEMVADWVAASRRHDDGSVWKSLAVNRERFKLDEPGVLTRIIENTIRQYAPMDVERAEGRGGS